MRYRDNPMLMDIIKTSCGVALFLTSLPILSSCSGPKKYSTALKTFEVLEIDIKKGGINFYLDAVCLNKDKLCIEEILEGDSKTFTGSDQTKLIKGEPNGECYASYKIYSAQMGTGAFALVTFERDFHTGDELTVHVLEGNTCEKGSMDIYGINSKGIKTKICSLEGSGKCVIDQ